MAAIELSEKETLLLEEILSSYLSELRMEVAGTDDRDVRILLKEKEAMVKDILNRLPRA